MGTTAFVAEALAAEVRRHLGADPTVRVGHTEAPVSVADVDLLVVGVPGAEELLAGLPERALEGVVAVPVLVAGSPRRLVELEREVPERLRELGAGVPLPGFGVLEAELDALDVVFQPWLRLASRAVAGAVRARRCDRETAPESVGC